MKDLKKGRLLLAEPFLKDPNFKRSVILLCEHDEKEGSVGFILNNLADLMLDDVIEDLNNFPAELYIGGPVQNDTLHFLHNLGNKLKGSIEIAEGVYWGGNFEDVINMINKGEVTPDNFRFFLGYSGWSPNQLDEEMKENSWMVHPAKSAHVFKLDADELWKQVLQEMGPDYAMMVNFPEDPILN